MSNITLQQAVDRLAVMAGKINKFKITLTTDDQGTTKELTLQEWLQTLEAHELVGVKDELEALTKLVGTYVADDDNNNLNQNVSVIKNLSEAVGNITSILNREKETAEKLENLAKLGTFKGHFNTEAERDAALPNAADGWVATIGATKPFDITIYDAADGKWETGGQTELFGGAYSKDEADLYRTIELANNRTPLQYYFDEMINNNETEKVLLVVEANEEYFIHMRLIGAPPSAELNVSALVLTEKTAIGYKTLEQDTYDFTKHISSVASEVAKEYTWLSIKDPTRDYQATTKKYVDDHMSTTGTGKA